MEHVRENYVLGHLRRNHDEILFHGKPKIRVKMDSHGADTRSSSKERNLVERASNGRREWCHSVKLYINTGKTTLIPLTRKKRLPNIIPIPTRMPRAHLEKKDIEDAIPYMRRWMNTMILRAKLTYGPIASQQSQTPYCKDIP